MKVKFNELPARVREQIVAVTTGQGDPRVLLSSISGGGWLKYVTAIGGVVAVGACFNFVYTRGQELAPHYDKEVYAGLAAGLFVAVASIVGIVYRFVWKPPPYREGQYVFHSGLVQLKNGEVNFTPIAQLARPTIVQVRRNGSYQHTRLELGHPFTFYFNSQPKAETTCTAILQAKANFARMLAARDDRAIYQVDPFAECTVTGQWTAPPGPVTGPTAPSVPKGARWARWGGALIFGIVCAASLYAIMDGSFEAERAAYDRRFSGPPKETTGSHHGGSHGSEE